MISYFSTILILKCTPPVARVNRVLIKEILPNSQKTNIYDRYQHGTLILKKWIGHHD